MKLIFTFLLGIMIMVNVFSQSPEKMSYQAVIRDAEQNLVSNQSVGVQISIIQGDVFGEAIYVETQTATTNANGLLSIEIGSENATIIKGVFSNIYWPNGPYFIKTETDPSADGETNYTISGTSQLISVPYALHAKTAESLVGEITETDPIYSNSEAANITGTDITNLDNLSGTNSGDQDLSELATKKALSDTATQVRSEIPDVSGFITAEADPSVPSGTQTGEMQYWDGTKWVTVAAGSEGQMLVFINDKPTWQDPAIPTVGPNDVYNHATGQVWMDRNLGALQVATSSTDADAFGDLYQWGRGTDGHEKRTSGITSTLSSSDDPGHGAFITTSSFPYDWRSPQNDNLWQGVSGPNNPCPSGYRLPTKAEWEIERLSWSSNDAAGAFSSPLKLTLSGGRSYEDGSIGTGGAYWTSTSNNLAWALRFNSSDDASMSIFSHASGFSVRCIKE